MAGMDGEVAVRCAALAEHLRWLPRRAAAAAAAAAGEAGDEEGGEWGRGQRAEGAAEEEGDWCRVVGGSSLATSLLEGGRRGQALLLGAVEGLDASLGARACQAPRRRPHPRREGQVGRAPAPREVCAGLYDACVSNAFGAPWRGRRRSQEQRHRN